MKKLYYPVFCLGFLAVPAPSALARESKAPLTMMDEVVVTADWRKQNR